MPTSKNNKKKPGGSDWVYPDDIKGSARGSRDPGGHSLHSQSGQHSGNNSSRRNGSAYPAHSNAKTRRNGEYPKGNQQTKKKKKKNRIRFSTVLTIFILVFILTSVAVFFIIRNIYWVPKGISYSSVTYDLAGTKEKNIKADKAYHNGVLYIDFSTLADELGMYVTGDSEEFKFIIPTENTVSSAGNGDEEYVSFKIDTLDAVVNGQETELPGCSLLYGKTVWVPAGFVTDYMNGLDIKQDVGKLNVSRTEVSSDGNQTDTADVSAETEISDDGNTYEVISFRQKYDGEISYSEDASSTETNASETDIDTSYDAMGFKNDLSGYESYMNPDGDSYLILVNTENTLSEDYVPDDLTDVVNTRSDRNAQQMREYAEKSLEALYIEMYSEGYTDVSVTSGYRSYDYQQQLFSSYVSQEMAADSSLTEDQAEQKVSGYSARPGTSEHQTGLCCDMHNLSQADSDFQYEAAYTWLSDNAWKFGFILRFPDGKTDETGIEFEPWHYRYVGRYHAARIHELGMCLEEYLDYTGISVEP